MKLTLALDATVFFAGQRIELPSLSEHELAAYAGQYQSAELDTGYEVASSSGGPVLRRNRQPEVKLVPVAQDEFEIEELGNVVFHRNANRRVSGLSVFVERARGLSFEKTR